MANGRKPAKTRPSPEKPAGGEQPIERSPVESRQGFRDRRVLYVLLASLALIIVAYILIASLWVR